MHDAGPARVNGRHRRADIFTEGQGDQCAWYASVPDRHPRDPPEPAPLGSPSPRSAGSRAPAGVAGERPLPRRAHRPRRLTASRPFPALTAARPMAPAPKAPTAPEELRMVPTPKAVGAVLPAELVPHR